MITCPVCRTQNPEGTAFCRSCNTPLSEGAVRIITTNIDDLTQSVTRRPWNTRTLLLLTALIIAVAILLTGSLGLLLRGYYQSNRNPNAGNSIPSGAPGGPALQVTLPPGFTPTDTANPSPTSAGNATPPPVVTVVIVTAVVP